MDTALPSAGSATTSNSVDQWRNNVPRLGFDVESDNDFGGDRTTVGSSSPTTNYSFGHNSAPSPVSSQAPSYLYYRLYDEDGPLSCQHPLQDDDPGLGRISVVQITPPHSANHIKRALRKTEKIPESSAVALYIDISGEHELDDETRVSTSGSGPGSDSLNALALVVTSEKVDTRHKVSKLLKGILKRKSRPDSHQSSESSPQIPAVTHLFDKRIKTIYKVDGFDDNWLSYEKGEILYTDGIFRFVGPNNDKVLLAQNEARQVGYVYAGDMSAP